MRHRRRLILALAALTTAPILPVRPHAKPASRVRPFDRVRGWRMLPWNLSLRDAKAKLKRVGLRFKHECSGRAYYAPSVGPGGRPRSPVMHVQRDRLQLRLGPWRASLAFRGWVFDQVTLSRAVKRLAEVDPLLARLRRRWGPPNHHQRAHPKATQQERAVWFSRTTSLRVTVLRYQGRITVYQTWSSLPRHDP